MHNVYRSIKESPKVYNQLVIDELLFAEYKCPIEEKRKAMWSENNYLIYVLNGRKMWQTPYGNWDMHSGDCVFVKKGACIVEQFFDEEFCLMMFFFPDQFIRKVAKEIPYEPPALLSSQPVPIITVHMNAALTGFFHSMIPYFADSSRIDKSLIHLKFNELILNLYTARDNMEIAGYFSHVKRNRNIPLQEIMESNFSYNMELSEYAELCGLSLSSFKRKFNEVYHTSPQKWLMARRLHYAKLLMETTSKPVTEIIFESGFENLSHFSRVFKDHFNESPQRYRKQLAPRP